MISRRTYAELVDALRRSPAVVLVGPRQVGKTTLAMAITAAQGGPEPDYLDLESPADRARLSDPLSYFQWRADRLVILDEIQRAPNLFEILRGVIDARLRNGQRGGQFLLLGSASLDLLRQASESLAGRISLIELAPLDCLDVADQPLEALWLRGGFPAAYLAGSDRDSALWRGDFITTFLERDIPQLGLRIPAETLRRFWTMLAHIQGGQLNATQLGCSLGVDAKTVQRYLDLMVDLMLVRRLLPFHVNIGKRLVKSPKIYIRDSGLLHTLLHLDTAEQVLSHPVAGASWEGFAIETLLRAAPPRTRANFYRTTAGAEIDLLLELPDGALWAIEIKRASAPKPGRGFHNALADLHPARAFIVYSGEMGYPLGPGVEAIDLRSLAGMLTAMAPSRTYWEGRVSQRWPALVRRHALNLVYFCVGNSPDGVCEDLPKHLHDQFIDRAANLKQALETPDAPWNHSEIGMAVHTFIENICPRGLGIGLDDLSQRYGRIFGYR